MIDSDVLNMIRTTTSDLIGYCKKKNWSGYDPYDGLNSQVFSSLPFFQNRIAKLVLTQGMKRSPINLRRILLIPPSQNPKGIALFSSSALKLLDFDFISESDAIALLRNLIASRSPRQPYYCWGYNFDWQQRVLLVPKYTPNIICTTFAGNALLDAYEKLGNSSFLEMATSSGDFLLKGLKISKHREGLCFSYTPLDNGQIHNANLLGAAFLARLYSILNEKKYLDYANSAVQFSVSKQASDGSWPYGENAKQKWIDNFHTGFNLVALHKFCQYTGNKGFESNIQKGFEFYKNNFFIDGGLVKYYHNRIYPIDIHSIAQSIITLIELKGLDPNNIELALSVFKWSLENMKDKDGYFYYQKKRFYINRIPYMRWSQAWMLYALAFIAEDLKSQSRIRELVSIF